MGCTLLAKDTGRKNYAKKSPSAHHHHRNWLAHYIYTFGGSCLVTEFYQVQNSLCVQVLRSPILAASLHGTRVVGVSQTLWRSAEGATYIRQGGHHVGHRPTF